MPAADLPRAKPPTAHPSAHPPPPPETRCGGRRAPATPSLSGSSQQVEREERNCPELPRVLTPLAPVPPAPHAHAHAHEHTPQGPPPLRTIDRFSVAPRTPATESRTFLRAPRVQRGSPITTRTGATSLPLGESPLPGQWQRIITGVASLTRGSKGASAAGLKLRVRMHRPLLDI
jgi:hypothetical protein